MISQRRFFSLFMAILLCTMLGACTSTVPEGKPMPELTFEHLTPLPIKVAAIDIENNYDPSADAKDMSSSFPTPPDIVLRRYAENRLEPAGTEGTLKFVIEDAAIHHSLVQPASTFTSWLGLHRKDLYEVFMKVRMYKTFPDGSQGTHAVLNMKRSIAIPQSYSVADKEAEKFRFLELLMQDVDNAVTSTLQNKMDLAGVKKEVSVLSLLSTPEVR